jgi:hypothetical protein
MQNVDKTQQKGIESKEVLCVIAFYRDFLFGILFV